MTLGTSSSGGVLLMVSSEEVLLRVGQGGLGRSLATGADSPQAYFYDVVDFLALSCATIVRKLGGANVAAHCPLLCGRPNLVRVRPKGQTWAGLDSTNTSLTSAEIGPMS